MVRELLTDGWSADDLGLGLEFDDGEAGDDKRFRLSSSAPTSPHGPPSLRSGSKSGQG